MRIPLGDKRFYDGRGPRFWPAHADAAWRMTPEIKAAAESEDDLVWTEKDGTAVMVIDGPIYGEARRVAKFMSSLDDHQPVRLDLDSPGGLVNEGTSIRTSLLRHSGKTTVQVMGLAGSAAQFLTTGADEVLMADGSQQFIHLPWTGALMVGNVDEIEKQFNGLRAALKSVTDIYIKVLAEKMQKPLSYVRGLLEKDTYLSAEESIELGLAHRIFPVVSSEPKQPESHRETALMDVVDGNLPSADELVQALGPVLKPDPEGSITKEDGINGISRRDEGEGSH